MRKQWSVVSGQWSAKATAAASRVPDASPLNQTFQLTTDHRPLTTVRGFTLVELVITLMVLTILTMGAIPLIKVSVKRQREQRLREALHQMRTAIDQFHREAIAGVQVQQQQGQAGQAGQPGQPGQPQSIDPRVRVAITDNTIFGTENPDRYPPTLETLVSGVSVTPLGGPGGGPIVGLSGSNRTATDNTLTATKKKIYLREIPIDPMTGERDWVLKSVYDSKDSTTWGGENVFDVHSRSEETALDEKTKYSDW
ncbi:MAG TPA: type II secretion system protein [Pyrinomonadaceae bacterium]